MPVCRLPNERTSTRIFRRKGRRSLKAVAPVQIRSGLLRLMQVKDLIAGDGGRVLDHLSLGCH